MNFAQLQAEVEKRCRLEGWTEVSPAPDFGALVNFGLRSFSWETEYTTGEAALTTIANQSDYDLSVNGSLPDWKFVTDCIYNGNAALYQTDENLLRRENPLWLTTSAGAPSRWLLPSPNTIRLYPTPNATGTALRVRGITAAAILVNPSDTPDIPEPYQEGVVLLAAWEHAKNYAQGESAARAAGYYAEGMKLVGKMRAFLAVENASVFQRRVQRERPERIALGWRVRVPN